MPFAGAPDRRKVVFGERHPGVFDPDSLLLEQKRLVHGREYVSVFCVSPSRTQTNQFSQDFADNHNIGKSHSQGEIQTVFGSRMQAMDGYTFSVSILRA